MSKQWRVYNQSKHDNLVDDDDEEYMMNQIVFNNTVDSSNDELVQRGGRRYGGKPNKDRVALVHAMLLHEIILQRMLSFDSNSFREVFHMCRCLFM